MSSPIAAASARPQTTIARKLLGTVLTAIAVAFVTHLAVLFIFSTAYQFAKGYLAQFNGLFIASSLFLLIALAVFGFIGAFTRWYFALLAGLVLSIGASLGGATIYLGQQQSTVAITPSVLIGTLLTLNLAFVVVGTLTTTLLGPRLYRALVAPRSAVASEARRIAVVRVPAENLAEGQVTHIKRSKVDPDKANEQWDAYVSALLDNGWSAVEVEPTPTLADSVFVEDAVVVFGSLAVITNPGSQPRRAEVATVEETIDELGLDVVHIEAPGTLDGGDVLTVGSTVYVGRGGRTNAEGVRQLRAILAGSGYSVVAVPVTKVLHLKSAVTALPDGTVIGHSSLLEPVDVFDRYLEVPEPSGAHVVALAEDTVLIAASAPKTAALLEDLGYRVVPVDISEFEKLEGCVTCLSVLVR